jgi:hypothetical protein
MRVLVPLLGRPAAQGANPRRSEVYESGGTTMYPYQGSPRYHAGASPSWSSAGTTGHLERP